MTEDEITRWREWIAAERPNCDAALMIESIKTVDAWRAQRHKWETECKAKRFWEWFERTKKR